MQTKRCPRCKIIKQIYEFSKSSREKDGLQTNCKSCNKIISAQYRANNVEKERERHAKYHVKNKETINARVSQWQKDNPDKRRAISKKFYQTHKESEKVRIKNWDEQNPDWKKNYTKQWRLNNADYRKQYEKNYIENNRGLVNAKTARRRALLMQATPKWTNKEKILTFYIEAARLTQQTGIEHNVDHIIPLRSKIVCGLHCEANLQVITKIENSIKHNKFSIL